MYTYYIYIYNRIIKYCNTKLPRIFILSLLIVSPYLHKDPQTI